MTMYFACASIWTSVKHSFIFGVNFKHWKMPKKQQQKTQRTNGPVNAHLISWPSKAQNIQNLENIW